MCLFWCCYIVKSNFLGLTLNGDDVNYDSTNSGLKLEGVTVDNVQDAIDALYEKSSVCKPALISFTVAGTTYQADEGMTWGDWVNSNYNTNQAYQLNRINGSMISPVSSNYYTCIGDPVAGVRVLATSQIVSGRAYQHIDSTGPIPY